VLIVVAGLISMAITSPVRPTLFKRKGKLPPEPHPASMTRFPSIKLSSSTAFFLTGF